MSKLYQVRCDLHLVLGFLRASTVLLDRCWKVDDAARGHYAPG